MRWWCKQGSMKTFSFFRKISLCVSRLDKSSKAIKITVKQIWCLKICANKLIYLSYLLCCICLLLFHPIKKKKKVVKIFWGFDPSWKEFFVKSLNQETTEVCQVWNPQSDSYFSDDPIIGFVMLDCDISLCQHLHFQHNLVQIWFIWEVLEMWEIYCLWISDEWGGKEWRDLWEK